MIKLRQARSDEAEALGRLGFASWERSPLAAADNGRADRHHLLNQYLAFCRANLPLLLVAEDDSQLLGWGARENGDNYISDLWVAPQSRRIGAGGALLQRMEDDIVAAGYGTAELETNVANEAAIGFYMRRGYVSTWRGEKFSTALGYSIEKLRFSKPLTAPAEIARP